MSKEEKLAAEIENLKSDTAKNNAERSLILENYEWTRRRHEEELAASDEHGLFELWGPVTDTSVGGVVRVLGDYSRKCPAAPIHIAFNSPGGSVFAGLALYDYIRSLQSVGHKITTNTIGYAASMGGILLQAGDERVAGRNAYMLIHEVSTVGYGKLSEIADEVKFSNRLQDRCCAILASRSTLSVDEIKKRWHKTDWWLDADEMLEFGFVDRIQ